MTLTDVPASMAHRWQVVHNAHSAQVTLENGKKFPATLKGAEPDKDLAVLTIDAPREWVGRRACWTLGRLLQSRSFWLEVAAIATAAASVLLQASSTYNL
eukprot:322561-Chlamydomonas_euryale.AAC.10